MKTIYTVCYDNEVLTIEDNYVSLKDYIFNEFGKDLSEEFERTIDRDEAIEVCHTIGVNWQKFTI